MRLSLKLFLLLALLALVGLSCKAVTGQGAVSTPGAELEDHPSRGALAFKPEALPDAQAGADYTTRVTVENTRTSVGDFSLKEGTLPPGLEMVKVEGEENTAEIRGTPTQAGTYKFTIYVWCYGTQVSGQTGEKEYTLVVK